MLRVAIVVALALLTPAASAGALLGTITDDPGEVLVGYRKGELATVTKLVASLGGTILSTDEDLRFLVVAARSTSQFLASVILDPAVEYAERNDVMRGNGAQWNGAQWNGAQWNGAEWNGAQWNADGVAGDPGAYSQWGLNATRAREAWNVTTGERRATLCILDSGVAWDHADLAANVWTAPDGTRGYNAIDPRLSPYDDAGHGTHMAGIAAAAVRNGIGVAGVANVTIIPVKVLTAEGTGKEDDLATGLVWCANRGANVALMALSVDAEGPTVRNALAYAARLDVLLVASAGNKGSCTNCVGYPARDPNVVAVSAITQGETLASFSSQGPQVDLAAPGVDIVSTFVGDAYVAGNGTSQASAFVAGAAALVRDAHPTLSAADVTARLTGSARDVGPAGHDARYGNGVVDVAAALGGQP